jgi:serine/threonine protein kinase
MRLGRYELLHRVARGGMAEVWAARQLGELGFSRIVAVKMILPELAEDAAFRKMFLEEARLASRIRHANVVEVLDLGEAASVVFQAMPLLEGDSLSGLQRRCQGRLPQGILLRVLCDALAGLHAAHELADDDGHPLHVIHRDVSPQNILVGLDGVARIADFGVAKALGRLAEETEAGQIKGKFGYLAPELAERKPADRRSDLFSAGVVLWEALTCTRLFKGRDAIETLDRVKNLAVPDPRTLNAEVSPALALATMRALARDPEDRFATAAQMAEELNQAARLASAEVTTSEVSVFVRELIGATSPRPDDGAQLVIERTREEAEASLATVAATTGHDPTQLQPSTRPRALLWLGAGAALVVGIGGASLVRAHAKRVDVAVAVVDALAPLPSGTVPEAPGTTIAGPVTPASWGPAQGSSPAPSAPAVPTASARVVPTARRSAPPRPVPKFANPYDR